MHVGSEDIELRFMHDLWGLYRIREMCGHAATNLILESQESTTPPYREIDKTRTCEQSSMF